MTFTVKIRGAGAPILAEYECPEHGRFEAVVQRNATGDPPDEVACPLTLFEWRAGFGIGEPEAVYCGLTSPWRISAPQLKRDSVPCYATVRGGETERRPGMLDTRPLAEGMSRKEWKAKQRAAREERRHHELIKKGLKTRRVQV